MFLLKMYDGVKFVSSLNYYARGAFAEFLGVFVLK